MSLNYVLTRFGVTLLLDLAWYFLDVRPVRQRTERYRESGPLVSQIVTPCNPDTSLFQYRFSKGNQWSWCFYKWTWCDVAASFIRHFRTIALRMQCRRLEVTPLITALVVCSCLAFSRYIRVNKVSYIPRLCNNGNRTWETTVILSHIWTNR